MSVEYIVQPFIEELIVEQSQHIFSFLGKNLNWSLLQPQAVFPSATRLCCASADHGSWPSTPHKTCTHTSESVFHQESCSGQPVPSCERVYFIKVGVWCVWLVGGGGGSGSSRDWMWTSERARDTLTFFLLSIETAALSLPFSPCSCLSFFSSP